MKIQMNQLMQLLLEQSKTDLSSIDRSLPAALDQLLTKGLRSEVDTLLFGHIFPLAIEHVDDLQLTEHEYFHNTLHIDDYVQHPNSEIEYLLFGLVFVKKLYALLEHQRKNPFRIQLSYKTTNYDNGNIDHYGGCTIKCFKLRKKAIAAFAIEPLNDFKEDAILILEG